MAKNNKDMNKGKNPQENRGFPNQNKRDEVRPSAVKTNEPFQDKEKLGLNKNPKKPR